MLQTNLETINTNHLEDLRRALDRGVRVRVLTLDPESRYVNERALQLNYPTRKIGVYRRSLQNAIDNVTTQLLVPGFLLRLYNDFPNQLTYIFDEYVLASIISRTGRSRNNCCFVLPSGHLAGPGHTFIEHFAQLWGKANQEIGGGVPSSEGSEENVVEKDPESP